MGSTAHAHNNQLRWTISFSFARAFCKQFEEAFHKVHPLGPERPENREEGRKIIPQTA
jgi:hypothetical protein